MHSGDHIQPNEPNENERKGTWFRYRFVRNYQRAKGVVVRTCGGDVVMKAEGDPYTAAGIKGNITAAEEYDFSHRTKVRAASNSVFTPG